MREWMELHHPRLVGLWDGPRYRLFGHCWGRGCPVPSRLNILHPPRQYRQCNDPPTPAGTGLTLRGWLDNRAVDPGVLDAWCESRGLDPGAVVEPVGVDPASVA